MNITTAKCCELIGNAADLADAVGIGFQYGYTQGTEAKENEYRKKPVENPELVKDLRQAIIYTVNKIRNRFSLNDIYKLTDLLRRHMHNKEYATLTESEWRKISIINHVMNMNSVENLKYINSFINGLEYADRKKASI
ncbi:MAG: hypothetical protein H2212_15970 [Ruminococcus sp.]|nr:hypothetical protein [Ruminococcus sp.]